MEDEKITPQNTVEKVKDLLESMDVRIDNTSLIQDNKIVFKFENKLYRSRMPSQRERTEAEDHQNRIRTKLIQEGGYKSRNQLRKILKDNGTVDLDLLDAEKFKLQGELKQAWLDMAVLLDNSPEAIAVMKQKAFDIENKHYSICIEIANWLSPSMEDRIEKEYVEYLTYLCSQKLVGDAGETYEPIWNSFKDFQDDSSYLTSKAVVILSNLILSTRQ